MHGHFSISGRKNKRYLAATTYTLWDQAEMEYTNSAGEKRRRVNFTFMGQNGADSGLSNDYKDKIRRNLLKLSEVGIDNAI